MLRVHTRQQDSPMRAAKRAITHCRSEHDRFSGEPVQVGRVHRVSLKIHRFPESRLPPEPHRMVTHLVGENVNDVGMGRDRSFLSRDTSRKC